jgi:signal transduction histidine kinase
MSARPLAAARWLRLPRRTARLRLTLLYSGLFMALGSVLIAIIFLLAGSASVSAGGAVAVFPEHVARAGAAAVRLMGIPIGIARQQHNADLGRLLEVSWVVLLLTAIGSAVLGWFAAGRVLAPLRSITTTARMISAGSLHQRLAIAGPDDEFKQLGDTLDDLLARLEASFESQRRFVANASHELRTPLTVERTLLQVALADPNASAEELRATCEEVLAAGAEQERLLESLLTLASSERGLDRRERLDLGLIAGQVLLAAEPERKRRSLELTTELAHAPTTGDPALVERLVANLIDNAVHYNKVGGRIEIRTAVQAGDALLAVKNTGAVIAPSEIGRLLEPFRRLGGGRAADSDGHRGLGLSIVRAIAVAHGATLDLQAPIEGGLVITVRFQAGVAHAIGVPRGQQSRSSG